MQGVKGVVLSRHQRICTRNRDSPSFAVKQLAKIRKFSPWWRHQPTMLQPGQRPPHNSQESTTHRGGCAAKREVHLDFFHRHAGVLCTMSLCIANVACRMCSFLHFSPRQCHAAAQLCTWSAAERKTILNLNSCCLRPASTETKEGWSPSKVTPKR